MRLMYYPFVGMYSKKIIVHAIIKTVIYFHIVVRRMSIINVSPNVKAFSKQQDVVTLHYIVHE